MYPFQIYYYLIRSDGNRDSVNLWKFPDFLFWHNTLKNFERIPKDSYQNRGFEFKLPLCNFFLCLLMLNFFEHINHTKIKQLQSWIILDVTGQKNVLRRILECESEYDPSNFCILACLSLETLIKKILLKKNSVSNLNEKVYMKKVWM